MKKIFPLIICLFSLTAISQDTTTIKRFSIGDYPVSLSNTCFLPCSAAVTFINVHDDENTSVEAVTNYLIVNGGRLLELQHIGNRNLEFGFTKKLYAFDPNRIYTSVGRAATLKSLSSYNDSAAQKVELLASLILAEFVDNKKLVIALHNNTDSNFSIASYKKGGSEAKNAGKLYINPLMDTDDFILTTEDTIYNYLKQKQISVVLQNNKTLVDDGSMSVYAAQKKIPYINVEAQHGHKNEQLLMLEALKDIIKFYEERDLGTNIEVEPKAQQKAKS